MNQHYGITEPLPSPQEMDKMQRTASSSSRLSGIDRMLGRMIRGILYRKSISRFLYPRVSSAWRNAEINKWNRQGSIRDCPYCGSVDSKHYCDRPLMKHFGLYDSDRKRLLIIYGPKGWRILPERFRAFLHQTALKSLEAEAYLSYRECKSCHLVYLNFPVSEQAATTYYREFYRNVSDDSCTWGRKETSQSRYHQRRRQIADYLLLKTQLPEGSKVLDIGCAEGWLCYYLVKQGMLAYGIDPSAPQVKFGETELGLETLNQGSYRVESYGNEEFDAIVTHHVIEHVTDIGEFLSAIGAHLREGGYLLLQCPCVDTIVETEDEAQIFKNDHLQIPSERFLRRALAAIGLEIIDCGFNPNRSQCREGSIALRNDGSRPGGISVVAKKHSGINRPG